jgi:hypothetical protein
MRAARKSQRKTWLWDVETTNHTPKTYCFIMETKKAKPKMKSKSGIKKLSLSVLFAIVGFIGSYVLGVLGFALSGAGHGSAVLGYLFISPNCKFNCHSYIAIGPIIWATVGALIPWLHHWHFKLLTVLLVAASYYSAHQEIAADLRETGTSYYVRKIFQQVPGISIPLVLVYVAMQLFIFWKLVTTKTNGEDGNG